MKRLIFTLVVAAALAPVAAFAGTSPSTTRAQQDCTKLRATMGLSAFNQAYANFGACVSAFTPVENQVQTSAQDTCTAQQSDPTFAASHNGKTFDEYYGTGPTHKNAFGNCVSSVARANANVERSGRLNPAGTCRSIRSQLGTALFNKTYGRNASDQNAFGKCVSSTAQASSHAQGKAVVNAARSCQSEQKADPAAFKKKYTTFGACVKSKSH